MEQKHFEENLSKCLSKTDKYIDEIQNKTF